MSTRWRSAASTMRQVMAKRAETSVKAVRSPSTSSGPPSARANRTRMKKVPLSGSSNC
jgi:hypothetical protein